VPVSWREAGELPFNSNFVIFDQDDQISLVKQTLKELNLDDKRRQRALQGKISKNRAGTNSNPKKRGKKRLKKEGDS
jgi:superfamily I DNA/RNA helicase